MIVKINMPKLEVYTNQIIHPIEFEKLYNGEEIQSSFKARVNNTHNRAFATFLAEERHKSHVKEGDLLIFRISKANKIFEFISQMGKWGNFHILKDAIDILKIENHEIIQFEIVKTTPKETSVKKDKAIDLAEVKENAQVLFRKNNFITAYTKKATPITLPRFIDITPELIELFFLIHGDGHYQYKLYFVNKEADLHKFVIAQFEELLRIPKSLWRARLLFNNIASQEKAKAKWKEELNLKDEQFYPKISKCVLNTSNMGNLRIVIDTPVVSLIFRHIFYILQDVQGKNTLHALNGLLCAEGSAEKSKRGLHKITINYSSKEKDMFQRILVASDIKKLVKDRGDRFVIEGWENCYQFFKVFLSENIVPFNLHKRRCEIALLGFTDHSFTRSMGKYLSILNKKDSMNTNEIIEETQHLGNSIRKILRKKQYIPFVISKGKGVNRNPIVFSITSEGKEFLTLTQQIKEVYNEQCKFRENKESEIYD